MLEQQVIPEFYDRDRAGIPQVWLKRIRASMARLTPQFSSNRMVREYVETIYRPASVALNRRIAKGAKLATELEEWHARIQEGWGGVRFGDVQVTKTEERWHFEAQVYSGDLEPSQVLVELYADPLNENEPPTRIVMCVREAILGAVNGYVYQADCPSTRPAHHFTPRIVPFHPEARVPLEESMILWKR